MVKSYSLGGNASVEAQQDDPFPPPARSQYNEKASLSVPTGNEKVSEVSPPDASTAGRQPEIPPKAF